MDIQSFVAQVFIHGVPYEEASKYDSAVVPTLLKMLEDPKQEAHWANIAVVLEIIGDERAVQPLIAFIEKGVDGKMSNDFYTAKTSALMGLGYLVNKTGNENVLNYLKKGMAPQMWDAKAMNGISSFQASKAERNMDLSKYAVLGLALSGKPAAAEAIKSLQKPMAIAADRAFQAQMGDVVTEALKANEEISQKGLVMYYRKSMP
jgi:HEAT repeat protein